MQEGITKELANNLYNNMQNVNAKLESIERNQRFILGVVLLLGEQSLGVAKEDFLEDALRLEKEHNKGK